jgi:hypothetical protein
VVAGVRVVLARDARGVEIVYPPVERASHYYHKITGSELAPCLVRQRI